MTYSHHLRRPLPAACDTPEKEALLIDYLLVQRDFCYALLADPLDWEMLFSLHFNLKRRERRSPWLKKVLL